MFLQKNVIFADKAHLFRKGNAEERPYGMAYAGQKRGVDAILVSFAWQSPNGFGLCARLTKRWLRLRFWRSAKYKQVCPLRSLDETLAFGVGLRIPTVKCVYDCRLTSCHLLGFSPLQIAS